MRRLYTFLIIFSSFYSFSQVGINTINPTSTLDVNGDVRIRSLTPSSTTSDMPLVLDANGVVKQNISSLQGKFRGRLFADFDSRTRTPYANGIYHINTIGEIIDAGDDFNHVSDIFTAPVTGTYEITMTVTVKGISTPTANYVAGLIDGTTNWVMRFSMQKEEVINAGGVGVARTYTGLAQLTAGQLYAFGFATGEFILIANPTGTTGTGIGGYYRIDLIDN